MESHKIGSEPVSFYLSLKVKVKVTLNAYISELLLTVKY